jgi:hypothetical protein
MVAMQPTGRFIELLAVTPALSTAQFGIAVEVVLQ